MPLNIRDKPMTLTFLKGNAIRCVLAVGLLLALLCPVFNSFSQELPFRRFTVDQGILSMEINDIRQDTKGYIWFATGMGICRYDGEMFRIFTLKDGISPGKILKISEDHEGNLYFLSDEGTLDIFSNESFSEHPQNNRLREIIRNNYPEGVVIKNNKELYMFTRSGKHYKITPSGVYVVKQNQKKLNCLYFTTSEKEIVWGLAQSSFQSKETAGNIIKVKNDTLFFKTEVNHLPEDKVFLKSTIHANRYLLGIGNLLYYLEKGKVKELAFNSTINCLSEDYKGRLWVGVQGEGVYVFGDMAKPPEDHFFNGKDILKIMPDRELGYWFVTGYEGVLQVVSDKFRVYPHIQEDIAIIRCTENSLYYITGNNQLFGCELSGDYVGEAQEIRFAENPNGIIEDMIVSEDDTIWILRSMITESSDKNTPAFMQFVATAYRLPATYTLKSFTLVPIRSLRFENLNIPYPVDYGIFKPKLFSMFYNENREMYLNTMEGLFSKDSNVNTTYYKQGFDLKIDITKSAISKNYMFYGTRNYGLQVMGKRNDIYILDYYSGLNSNFVRTICVDNDSVAWIATNNGLSCLSIWRKEIPQIRPRNIKVQDGLPYGEINEIWVSGNLLFLATTQGLAAMEKNERKTAKGMPGAFLSGISINDRDTFLLEDFNLPHNANSLMIRYRAISMKSPAKMMYKYRMIGLDSNWVKSNESFVRYPKLPAGDYVFQLVAGNEEDGWSAPPVEIRVHIREHFTQSAYFQLGLSFFLLGIIILIARAVIRTRSAKEEVKRNLLEAEIKTLRSQMNPHFIYNSISSIGAIISDYSVTEAKDYVGSFGQLLRKVLQSAREPFIKLHEELSILDIYMKLQQQKLMNGFDYRIKVDESIYPDTVNIPPMLLQPFVENSIIHGFGNKAPGALLTLKVKDCGDHFTVIIEDNGMGREKSKLISQKRKDYKSTGLDNIRSRIQLINQIYKCRIHLNIIDLYNEKGEAKGTRVELIFPYSYSNTLIKWSQKLKLKP